MPLSLCDNCGSIEGGFVIVTAAELSEVIGVPSVMIDEDELEMLENLACEQCGEIGGYTGIPEHDDMDMER